MDPLHVLQNSNIRTAILGANGYIGRGLWEAIRQKDPDCIGTSQHTENPELSYLDLAKPDIAPLGLARKKYTHAVIAAGIARVDRCEMEKDYSRSINVQGTCELIRQLHAEHVIPVFLSTDYVFDGERGGYTEDDPVHPITEYGRQKVEVERFLQESDHDFLILRLSKVFGLKRGDGTLLDEMAGRLYREEKIRAATDQIFCPLWRDDTVRAIREIIQRNKTGIFHLCSLEAWTRYDIACAIAKAMGKSCEFIERISLDQLNPSVPRPKNTSMKAERLKQENLAGFTAMEQCILKIAELYQTK